LMAGGVPLMVAIWHSAKRAVDSGELKLIAGAGGKRFGDAPQVATIAETYAGFDVVAFNALVAPAGVPAPVLDKLSADIRSVVNSGEFVDRVRHLGISPAGNTLQELNAWIRREMLPWGEIAKAANTKADAQGGARPRASSGHRPRRAPDRAGHGGVVALSRRLLARDGGGARHQFARNRPLSAQRAAAGAAAMARQKRARRRHRRRADGTGLRPLAGGGGGPGWAAC